MVQHKLRNVAGRVSRERLPLGPAHPFRPLRIDGELYGEGHGLRVVPGAQRHAVLLEKRRVAGFAAGNGLYRHKGDVGRSGLRAGQWRRDAS